MPKRNVEYYSKILALKYGIKKKDAHKVLMNAFKNLARQIEKGNDVRIPHFGHLYFNKSYYAKYIKETNDKMKQSQIKKYQERLKKNNQSGKQE